MAWFLHQSSKRVLATTIAVAMFFGLSACGSDNPGARDKSPDAKAGKDTAGQNAKSAQKVRIGYLNVMDDAQTILAQEAGLYKKQGLDAELQLFNSGTDLIKAIIGGQLDAGILGFTNALSWLDKGANLKIVGGAQMGYHSLLVRENSGIRSIADLKGRSLASQKQGSTADIVLNGVVLKQAGLARNDVQMQYVSPSVAIQSLAAGKVDAAFVFEPYDHVARVTSHVQSIYEIGKEWPFPCMVVITSGKMTKDNHVTVNRMLDAQKEAIDMLQKQPNTATELLTKHFIKEESLQSVNGGTVPAMKVIQDAIQAQTFTWAITPDQSARMQEIADMMVEQGILKKRIDVKQALDLSWQEQIKQ